MDAMGAFREVVEFWVCGIMICTDDNNRWVAAMDEKHTFSVVLEPHEGGFLVHVPALPEIVTGGETEEEALAMARDAIALVLESRRERREAIPVEIGKARVREVIVSVAA
jgi:antitoxin HicB